LRPSHCSLETEPLLEGGGELLAWERLLLLARLDLRHVREEALLGLALARLLGREVVDPAASLVAHVPVPVGRAGPLVELPERPSRRVDRRHALPSFDTRWTLVAASFPGATCPLAFGSGGLSNVCQRSYPTVPDASMLEDYP
jgi:hypothetical protein